MPPIGDLLAQITGEPSPTLSSSPVTLIRKAENDIRRPSEGAQRAKPSVARPSAQIPHSNKNQASHSSNSNSTVNPTPPSNQRPGPQRYIPPTPKSVTPTAPATSAMTNSSKPPKKGSFAEIMARAKAAQANLGAVGKIQHKRIEKREREDIKARRLQKLGKTLASEKMNGRTGQAPLRDERNSVRENSGKVGSASKGLEKDKVLPEKKVKKAALATTGYTGTARPKPGSARSASASTSRPAVNGNRSSGYGGGSSSKRYYVSEEDEEEEEEEENYYSDVSSDMEAAVYEVDKEEEYAERIARHEDAEALREEMRLKREKEEKRKRLIAMAKRARR
ncbi:hypothetical protein B7463_g1968, partial [Scytalidium lignicola]